MTTQRLSYEARQDAGKLVLRILIGGLMLFHGLDKLLHGVGGVQHDLAGAGLPGILAYGVYIGEVIAPALILVGIWTRPAAAVYALTILFASLLVHAGDYGALASTGGWAAEVFVFYIVGAGAIALLGAGRYSLRHEMGRWD